VTIYPTLSLSASIFKKQLIQELDTTEDVDKIEAFFEGTHTALAVDKAFSVTNYVRHSSCDRGIAHDRGKPRDLSLSLMSHVTVGTHVTLGTHVIKREPFKT
jgi:hypothetical protein